MGPGLPLRRRLPQAARYPGRRGGRRRRAAATMASGEERGSGPGSGGRSGATSAGAGPRALPRKLKSLRCAEATGSRCSAPPASGAPAQVSWGRREQVSGPVLTRAAADGENRSREGSGPGGAWAQGGVPSGLWSPGTGRRGSGGVFLPRPQDPESRCRPGRGCPERGTVRGRGLPPAGLLQGCPG